MKLRFWFPAPEYQWFPTLEEFEAHPLESLVLYESLYAFSLFMLGLISVSIGFLIGVLIAL